MARRSHLRPLGLLGSCLLAATAGLVIAQADPGDPSAAEDKGITPVDSGGSFEVDGVRVDTYGKTADEARLAGWRLAQRKGWQMLGQRLGGGAPALSDGALDQVVSGIVIEDEQIGPNRYVARLGVLFSRSRAGPILGYAGPGMRSQPMLVVPVMWSGGAGTVFEQRTPWQEAWARFRTGNSAVDYVRPTGTGPDALLLNAGQTLRPGRGWWRTIIDQYGAADVLIPVVKLYRQWPGGPVIGVFQARHGPDNRLLQSFTLRVNSAAGLPALLDAGVKRLDQAYADALSANRLGVDPGLAWSPPAPTPTGTPTPLASPTAPGDDLSTFLSGQTTVVQLQVDTPSVASVASTEAMLRGIPGVRTALTTSLALGGVSIMRVEVSGDPAALRAGLEARGWQVTGSGATLRVRRPQLAPPPGPQDGTTAG